MHRCIILPGKWHFPKGTVITVVEPGLEACEPPPLPHQTPCTLYCTPPSLRTTLLYGSDLGGVQFMQVGHRTNPKVKRAVFAEQEEGWEAAHAGSQH